jgi:2-dehydro-3-deoxygalactonokinase
MGKYIVTIDTGTTNTRTMLWDSTRNQMARETKQVGVRDTAIDGNNSRLKAAVRECLEAMLRHTGITYDDVGRVIASGMITSEAGLVEIPHLIVPAGADELAAGMTSVLLEDVCPLPIWFIPGVKNSGGPITMDNLEKMDIMRGEEVESVYLIEQYRGKELLLVLPGSHTKFISVDSKGRMTGCLTTITGELLGCIIEHTILAGAVGNRYIEEETYDRERMLEGYRLSKKVGLARACFSGRIEYLFVRREHNAVGNFILGAALSEDVTAVRNSSTLHIGADTNVVVAGKSPLREALADVLDCEGIFASVRQFAVGGEAPLSALGAYIIAEKSLLL